MALERGVLVVKQVGKGKLPRIQVRVGETLFNPSQGEISQFLLDRIAEFAGREVEFERVSGQPKKIREAGGAFVPPRRQGQELRPRDERGPGSGAPHLRRPEPRRERGSPTRRNCRPAFITRITSCRHRRGIPNTPIWVTILPWLNTPSSRIGTAVVSEYG